MDITVLLPEQNDIFHKLHICIEELKRALGKISRSVGPERTNGYLDIENALLMFFGAERLLNKILDNENSRKQLNTIKSNAEKLSDIVSHGNLEDAPMVINRTGRLWRDIDLFQDSLTEIGKKATNKKWRAKEPAKDSKKRNRQKTKAQLLKGIREEEANKILNDPINDDITVERLGELLGCNKSTACRLDAWKRHQERKKYWEQKTVNGFKLSKNIEGPDIESFANCPKAEHYDIKAMIEAYKSGESKTMPTAQVIADKLSLKDKDEAIRLLNETVNHFPDIAEYTYT